MNTFKPLEYYLDIQNANASEFPELQHLLNAVKSNFRNAITNYYSYEKAAQFITPPSSSIAPVEIADQWVGTIIPADSIESGGINTSSTHAIISLGLNVLDMIAKGKKSPDEIMLAYKALAFWKEFDLKNGNMPFIFRPKEEGKGINSFVNIMKVAI